MTGRRAALLVGLVLAVGGAAATYAIVSGTDRDDGKTEVLVSPNAVAAAKMMAVMQTPHGGRVTGTEVGGDESFYEVEVTRRDGRQFVVHLNRRFELLGREIVPGRDPAVLVRRAALASRANALAAAKAVALSQTPSGSRVTGVEVGGDAPYYAVEVTTRDGRKFVVDLDRRFVVHGKWPVAT